MLKFENLLELEELGICSGVVGIGLEVTYKCPPGAQFKRVIKAAFIEDGITDGLLVKHAEADKKLVLRPIINLTRVGRDLLSLNSYILDKDYLISVANYCKKNDFEVFKITIAITGLGEGIILKQDPL